MLQPQNNQTPQNAWILWLALNASMLFYGALLIFLKKISHIAFPSGDPSMFESMSLAFNCMLLVTFFIHNTKVKSESDFKKKFPMMVICWALNESIAIMAFGATFISTSGNGFYFLTNFMVAIIANIIMRPTEKMGL